MHAPSFALGVLSLAWLSGPLAAQDTTRVTAPAGASAAAPAGGAARTTLDGVFTTAQAKRGEELFWNVCAECHTTDDFGREFLEGWKGATLWTLYDELRNTMPEDNPGGLRRSEYADAVAYMLHLNDFPPGDAELGSAREALDPIKIEWDPPSTEPEKANPEAKRDTLTTRRPGAR